MSWLILLAASLGTATSTPSAELPPPIVATSTPAAALEPAPAETDLGATLISELLSIQIHGFVSQGFMLSSGSNYLAKSRSGSAEFSEVGLNFTKTLTDDLRAGIQLFARDLGPLGNYSAKLDWFYLDYRYADWLGFRAGRVKLPFGLYNDSSDTDSARVPVLLPQSVYPIANRDYLLAQTGAELYGYHRIGAAGSLDYRLYAGTLYVSADESLDTTNVSRVEIEWPYLYGSRLIWGTPIEGLRLAGSIQALRFDLDFTLDPAFAAQLKAVGQLPADSNGIIKAKAPVVLWVASLEYIAGDLMFAAEYSRWHSKTSSDVPLLIPETKIQSERFYGMLSYHLRDWFTPGLYYSVLFPNKEMREGRANSQQDVALSFRFDINAYWLIKLEGHYMRGTAAVQPTLNDARPNTEAPNDWAVFFAKTTLSF